MKLCTSIADGAYLALSVVDPLVEFEQPGDFEFETDANITTSTDIQLNYRPAMAVNVDFSYSDNSAVLYPPE